MERATVRQQEIINRKFMEFYSLMIPLVEELKFDAKTGKVIIPKFVTSEMLFANKQWNYHVMLFNKKMKKVHANYGAVKTKFEKEVAAKEMKMFLGAVAKIFEEKYNLTHDKIDVEYIVKYMTDDLTPEQVCDRRVLEIAPDKVHWYKHRHAWIVISGENNDFVIICKSCRKQYSKRYLTSAEAQRVAVRLPKTNFGLFVNHFKNYNK